jgi:hypothetical protein
MSDFRNIFPDDSNDEDAQRDTDHSFLNKLDEKIYARRPEAFTDMRTKLIKKDLKNFSWEKGAINKKQEANYNINLAPAKKGFSLFSLSFLVFSIIIFLGSIAYAFYSLSIGGFTVKQDSIEMKLDLPSIANSGQNITGRINIANTNKVEFIESMLAIDIVNPDESIENVSQIEIGKVSSGQNIEKNLSFSLNGRENEVKNLKFTLFYKVKDSDSTFEKNISHSVKISKSQVIVNLTGPKSITLGQVSEYRISVRGGDAAVPSVAVQLDLPRDLQIIESSVNAESKNYFVIGDLKAGEEKILSIKTKYKVGQELIDSFSIKVTVGTSGESKVKDILSENSIDVALAALPFKVAVSMSGKEDSTLYFSGKTPKVKVTVSNVSQSMVQNGVLDIKLSGGLFNAKTVSISGAQYDAGLGTIRATQETNKALKELRPGEKVEFEIAYQDLNQTNQSNARRLIIDTSFTADIPDSVNSPAATKVLTTLLPKDNTNVVLKTYYFSGAFKNIGPMPPRIGQKTSYTVIASIDTLGGFDKGVFTTTLPEYVTFIESSEGTAVYKKDKRELVWSIGSMQKSSGEVLSINKKEISFRVSITPSPDQFRLSPDLTRDSKFEAIGIDKNVISIEVPNVNINFSQDPKYQSAKGYAEVAQ